MYREILNNHKHRNSKGYTLLEILVAMLFFGILVLSLSHTLTSSFMLTGKDKKIANANNLAIRYLREVELEWRTMNAFDSGTLPDVSNSYTVNGKYYVNVSTQDLVFNQAGDVIVRRVTVKYKSNDLTDGDNIVKVYLDFFRPDNV
jgi:prepilin-type N-terminal cleavage/methylation domain-containing protein